LQKTKESNATPPTPSTGELNKWFKDVVTSNPPPMSCGRTTKLKYIVQAKARPPTFRIFGNVDEKVLGESYVRYVRNEMRRDFGMEGMAVRIGVSNTNVDNPFKGKGRKKGGRRKGERGGG